jgi:hypothetical protein
MADDPENADLKEPESNPSPAPSPLAEGFQAIRYARAKWTGFWIYAVPVIAVIYGAVTLTPYYVLLGLAALALLWWF